MSIVYIFKLCNPVFLVRVLGMPHPLCTCTLRVLYACGREFVPSVYFLPITWNGISPPQLVKLYIKVHKTWVTFGYNKE